MNGETTFQYLERLKLIPTDELSAKYISFSDLENLAKVEELEPLLDEIRGMFLRAGIHDPVLKVWIDGDILKIQLPYPIE